MRQGLASKPVCPRQQESNLACPLFTMPNRTLRRSLRHLQTQRLKVNRRTLKRIITVVLFVTVLLFLGYLESGFLPNH
jgi:hypothetical protein